jgi:hypothetical protein
MRNVVFAVLFSIGCSVFALADAVSGRVLGPDGKPELNKTFAAQSSKGQPVVFKTDGAGNFSVYLDAGRYTVTSSADATVEGTIESYPQPVQQDVRLKKK